MAEDRIPDHPRWPPAGGSSICATTSGDVDDGKERAFVAEIGVCIAEEVLGKGIFEKLRAVESQRTLRIRLSGSGDEENLAGSSRRRLAAFVYRLVANARQALQTYLYNYAIGFRSAHAAGTVLAVPCVAALLADPSSAPLEQWFRQRQVPLARVAVIPRPSTACVVGTAGNMKHETCNMNQDHPNMPYFEKENLAPRQAAGEVSALLRDAAQRLNNVLQDEPIMAEIPLEVEAAMESSLKAIGAALRWLDSVAPARSSSAVSLPGGPTRQQGQFSAFIREYMLRNEAGVAPSHADFMRFFNLTPPSVNSMLIRLEQRGFIRRIPHTARAIELVLNPDWIPPLDRPFKF